MKTVFFNPDFDSWRLAARDLLIHKVEPHTIHWSALGQTQSQSLFSDNEMGSPSLKNLDALHTHIEREQDVEIFPNVEIHVPKKFLENAKQVAFHRSEDRWGLFYRLLFQYNYDKPNIFDDVTDSDVIKFRKYQKEIFVDIHKLHAFVRFRKYSLDTGEVYLAWYRPKNPILKTAVPFFVQRFPNMNWAIFTDDESAFWNGENLAFGLGCPKFELQDDLELLWKTYYSATYNPNRLNLKILRSKMPARLHDILPEASEIPLLIENSNSRVEKFKTSAPTSAEPFVPPSETLAQLFAGLPHCKGCPLWKKASQVVPGHGNFKAKIFLIGEQPGDEEDRRGLPFVGPAGQVLKQALADAGLSLEELYLTNTVKHFKWREDGTSSRRLHQRANSAEISACRPWLENELRIVRPQVVVCLGGTSAQAIFGRLLALERERGMIMRSRWTDMSIATFHPSAVLRAPNDERKREIYDHLVTDLKLARQLQHS